MSNADHTAKHMPSIAEMQKQSRHGLFAFFKRKSVKSLVGVLVPAALAAILFPVFGPAVASQAGVIAVKNSLNLIGIPFSSGTVGKLLTLLQGKPVTADIIQNVLEDLLPVDAEVNEDVAKTMVMMMPVVKEAAMANPELDLLWLQKSLESNFQQQGGMLEGIAPELQDMIRKDQENLKASIDSLLANWARFSEQLKATQQNLMLHQKAE